MKANRFVPRVVLVGLGTMGSHHLRELNARDDAKVVGIIDPIRTPSHPLAATGDQFGRDEVDLCIVASPTATHSEWLKWAVDREIRTLVEKPAVRSTDEGVALERYCGEKLDFVSVGHIERFNPVVHSLKSLIDSHELGELLEIQTVREGPNPERITDVGLELDLGTHDFDLVRWLTGQEFAVVKCMSFPAQKEGKRAHGSELMHISGRLTGDALVNVTLSWLAARKRRSIRVTLEGGQAEADLINQQMRIWEAPSMRLDESEALQKYGPRIGRIVEVPIAPTSPLRLELDAILKDDESAWKLASWEDGLRAIEIAERVRASACK